MKTRLLLLIACLYVATTHAQTIRRVNNTPGVTGPNVYTTVQAAHDAAATGDIIYVEPSATAYSTLTLTKRLTIYGTGYLLDENASLVNVQNRSIAVVGNVSFANGSSNSVISGLQIEGSITFQGTVSGITVERCRISSNIIFNSTCTGATSQFPTNCTIRQCFLTSGSIQGSCDGTSNIVFNATGISIVNCILRDGVIARLNSCVVLQSHISNGYYRISNSTVSNNTSGYGLGDSYNNTVNNNVCSSNCYPNENGNLNNQSNIFIGGASWIDSFYRLAIGSPAIGAGAGGVNCGPFGGPNPYVLSGLPPVPIITNLISSPSGNNNAPLNIRMSVQSNN